jgi:hypothetical protein
MLNSKEKVTSTRAALVTRLILELCKTGPNNCFVYINKRLSEEWKNDYRIVSSSSVACHVPCAKLAGDKISGTRTPNMFLVLCFVLFFVYVIIFFYVPNFRYRYCFGLVFNIFSDDCFLQKRFGVR